jgi:hypothetical protein
MHDSHGANAWVIFLFALLFASMGGGAGANGDLVGEVTTGPWTVDGQLQVTDIHLQRGMLQIKGKRLTVVFDPTTKKRRSHGNQPQEIDHGG